MTANDLPRAAALLASDPAPKSASVACPHRRFGEPCVECRAASDASSEPEIEPLDWLLNWVQAQNSDVSSHYWHMTDGHHRDCGCPLEGDDDAR